MTPPASAAEHWGILAADLGGTRLRIAVFDNHGALLHKDVIRTPPQEPQALPAALQQAARQQATGAGGVAFRAAVVGVPGPLDYAAGEILRLPNLPAWEGHFSARTLANAFQLPVLLANDADLAAVGEHRYGAGQGTANMLYVTSSTGVGAGVILNGRLLQGRWSLAEAGHTIIDYRSAATLESLGSGSALARLAGEDAARVEVKAKAGDSKALAQFQEVADAFAVGVLNLVHCFMPERVVIGGGMARAGDLLLNPVRERLARCDAGFPISAIDVVPARGGDDVGLLGALALALDALAGSAAPGLRLVAPDTAPGQAPAQVRPDAQR